MGPLQPDLQVWTCIDFFFCFVEGMDINHDIANPFVSDWIAPKTILQQVID